MRVKNVNKHLFESVSTIKSWGVNLHFNTYTKSWFWLCEEVLKVIYAHLLTALFFGGGEQASIKLTVTNCKLK